MSPRKAKADLTAGRLGVEPEGSETPQDDILRKVGAFQLRPDVLALLKAYALATNQEQYLVVEAAVKAHLEAAIAALPKAKQNVVESLAVGYAE